MTTQPTAEHDAMKSFDPENEMLPSERWVWCKAYHARDEEIAVHLSALEALEALLREIEWVGWGNTCLICKNPAWTDGGGHAPGCCLAAALK